MGFFFLTNMRIRTIKPEFFTHEDLYELEKSTKLPVRLAYAGLWCAADREGRFKWEPRRLGVSILPYDSLDFSRVLDALVTRGFIQRYASGGREFGAIPSFSAHQVINNRERESELPEPPPMAESDACPTRAPHVPHATLTCTSGREGKGKEHGREGNMEVRAAGAVLDFPEQWSDARKETMTRWLAYKREKGATYKPAGWQALCTSLSSFPDSTIAEAVRQSMANNWQGLFPEKITNSPTIQALPPVHNKWQRTV